MINFSAFGAVDTGAIVGGVVSVIVTVAVAAVAIVAIIVWRGKYSKE